MAVFGVIAVIGGVAAFSAEQSHFFSAGFTPEERIDLIVAGSRQTGISSQTQRQFMIDCRNSIIHAVRLDMDNDKRTELAKACQRAAHSVTESNPASSFAWFALSHSALALADWPEVNRGLAISQKTGTNEGWIARYRVELVEDNRANIDATYMPKHREDLSVLAENLPAYQDFLARIYLIRPDSRPDLTEVIETLAPRAQRSFLSAVERARQSLVVEPST